MCSTIQENALHIALDNRDIIIIIASQMIMSKCKGFREYEEHYASSCVYRVSDVVVNIPQVFRFKKV